MEEKSRITVKVALESITTLEDIERFVATAHQVLDQPELLTITHTPPAGLDAGRVGLVATGTPKTAQHATSAPDPTVTTEGPGRVEEWPEDDEHLWPYSWRDSLGRVWDYGSTGRMTGWSINGGATWSEPSNGPWTRVEGADL